MRKTGVITERRRRRERGKALRRRAMAAGFVLLLCALAASEQLRERLAQLMESGVQAVGAFADMEETSVEIALEEAEVYALQLGVYDSGERALSEQQRLMAQGVPCIIWQRDKMRLICSVAMSREALDTAAAGGNEAYIVRDTLPEVRLRIGGTAKESGAAAEFIRLPDRLLQTLMESGEGLDPSLIENTRQRAGEAVKAYAQQPLCAELAQSLLEWCDLMASHADQATARSYAAVTMCTICREWRTALLSYAPVSEASAASAQRTPSTAADVMPPA